MISGIVLGVVAVLIPLVALPAVGLGIYAIVRRRYLGGVVTILVAFVGAVTGVLLVFALEGGPDDDPDRDVIDGGEPIPNVDDEPAVPADDGEPFAPTPEVLGWQPDATDVAVLGDYFDARFLACQQGLTPEWPNCAVVYDGRSQAAWLDQHGYGDCRLDGGSADTCVLLLPTQ